MRLGVIFPQTEIGSDPLVLRDYAQAAEDLGYDHLLAFDHVLGAQPGDHRPGWTGPYNYQTTFHEPFVLFGYLGAITTKIEFVTGILILPQRQTALVAKQAAEVDLLTNERLRLGVANGWNDAEYETLNEDFHNRGRRIEEQVEVMRKLWTEEVVTFEGKWHTLNHVAIAPAAAAIDSGLVRGHVGGGDEAHGAHRRRLVPAVPPRRPRRTRDPRPLPRLRA